MAKPKNKTHLVTLLELHLWELETIEALNILHSKRGDVEGDLYKLTVSKRVLRKLMAAARKRDHDEPIAEVVLSHYKPRSRRVH